MFCVAKVPAEEKSDNESGNQENKRRAVIYISPAGHIPGCKKKCGHGSNFSKAGKVKWTVCVGISGGDNVDSKKQAGNTDRDINEENPVPAECRDENAAKERCYGRGNESRPYKKACHTKHVFRQCFFHNDDPGSGSHQGS